MANWEFCPQRGQGSLKPVRRPGVGHAGGEVGVGAPLRQLATNYLRPRSATSQPLAVAFQRGGRGAASLSYSSCRPSLPRRVCERE